MTTKENGPPAGDWSGRETDMVDGTNSTTVVDRRNGRMMRILPRMEPGPDSVFFSRESEVDGSGHWRVLHALKQRGEVTETPAGRVTKCPVCDRGYALTLTRDGGRAVLACSSGCTVTEIVEKLGVDAGDVVGAEAPKIDAEAIREFVELIHPEPAPFMVAACQPPGGKYMEAAVTGWDPLAQQLATWSAQANVWFSCASFGRGCRKAEAAQSIGALWLDLDVRGPAHKETRLPASKEDALAFVREAFPHEPSVIVDSGHGLQCWWLLREPWTFESEEERREAEALSKAFQGVFLAAGEKHGWEIDDTADLARILRPVGSVNRKLEPVSVRYLERSDRRYNPSEIREAVEELGGPVEAKPDRPTEADPRRGEPPSEHELAQIRSVLEFIPAAATTHKEWRDVGWALHSRHPDLREDFIQWSEKDKARYHDGGETPEALWSRAEPGGGVTIKSLFKWAGERGWKMPADLPPWEPPEHIREFCEKNAPPPKPEDGTKDGGGGAGEKDAARPREMDRARSIAQRLQPVPASFFDQPPPTPMLVRRWDAEKETWRGVIPRGYAGVIAAEGGTGKSFALLQLAVSIVTGEPWLGMRTNVMGDGETRSPEAVGRVALFFAEDEMREVHTRFHAILGAYGLAGDHGGRERLERGLYIAPLADAGIKALVRLKDGNIEESDVFREIQTRLDEAGPWDLVVLDPLAQFAGLDENANHLMNTFVQVASTLTKVNGNPAVILAHHSSKQSAQDGKPNLRGASSIRDGVRYAFTMSADAEGRLVTLTHEKNNYTAKARPMMLVRGDDGVLRVENEMERSLREAAHNGDDGDRDQEKAEAAMPAVLEILAAPRVRESGMAFEELRDSIKGHHSKARSRAIRQLVTGGQVKKVRHGRSMLHFLAGWEPGGSERGRGEEDTTESLE